MWGQSRRETRLKRWTRQSRNWKSARRIACASASYASNICARDEARRIAANVAKLPGFIEPDKHRKAKAE
jgi:hypothetical protein